ncbi:MAG TPA: TatD family hydrolase [Rhodanobacteraceae bacterium]
MSAANSADTAEFTLFDSHAHIDADAFDNDRGAVLRAARSAGVREILVPAVSAATWPKLESVCNALPGLFAAYGLHPCYAHADADVARLQHWLEGHTAAAVGECGLDFSVSPMGRERQIQLLHAQFEIACVADLPLVLHARHAFEQIILEIRRFAKPLRGVVHSFSGSAEQAHELHRLGFSVGIGGPVTYARAQRLRRVAATLPADSLLLETDAPDQPAVGHRGSRNEPAFLREVLVCVASLRGDDPHTLAAQTRANARRLFCRLA